MSNKSQGKYKISLIVLGIAFAALISVFLFNGPNKENTSSSNNAASSKVEEKTKVETTSNTDLIILKSEVSETAKFYPYKADNVYMEVIAVKAKDGTIRTALNTCQVCYASGKGYYKQKGDALVCQNCGNVFNIDQVEKMKNGCNPVPATNEDKKDDGNNIVISKTFMQENKNLFAKWSK